MSAQGRRPKPWARKRRESARDLALQILFQTESRSSFSDRLLETRLKQSELTPEDARLVTALVQGGLRRRATLDHHLAAFAGAERWENLPSWIRGTLRLGAYQLLYMDRVPSSAAVDESVELAKKYGHPGTAGLVNAVLRRLAGGERAPFPDAAADPAGYLAVFHSHPRWIVERWVAQYGPEEAARLLDADNAEPLVSVRANALRMTREQLLDALKEEGVAADPAPNGGPVLLVRGGFVVGRSRLFREGFLSLQDEAESLVAAILDSRPGDSVLDLCAAPGGKTAQIAEAVAPRGRVVAVERHLSRARATRENLVGRLKVPGAHVVCADGGLPPFRAPFDRVLVDAPCSGLGVLRRRADARWRKEAATIPAMVALQRPLLESGASLVRAGGTLVYSVCSLEPEETDGIVGPFLRDHSEFTVEDANPYVPETFRSADRVFRATPHRHRTDGVFAARLRRR